MISLKLVERAMYSASVVDSAVIVCILEAQMMGATANQTTQPELDLDVIGSLWVSCWHQLPAKLASTQHSKCLRSLGRTSSPLSRVANKYYPILLTTSARLCFGFSEKRAHWCTLMEMSGRVDFSKKFNFPIMLR